MFLVVDNSHIQPTTIIREVALQAQKTAYPAQPMQAEPNAYFALIALLAIFAFIGNRRD